MKTLLVILGVLVAASTGCKKGGGGAKEYRNDHPKFKVSYPGDLEVRRVEDGTDGLHNLSIATPRGDRELFLVWAPTGSQLDPEAAWGLYGHERDHVKTLSEGALPGGGKYLVNDRGARIYIHAVMTTDSYGVLCMASIAKGGDMSLLDHCKTLAGT